MNERDIEFCKQAGWPESLVSPVIMAKLKEFADIIRADEREACADIAENWNSNGSPRVGVAKAIRARGNTNG